MALLNVYRDVEVTWEKVIKIIAKVSRRMVFFKRLLHNITINHSFTFYNNPKIIIFFNLTPEIFSCVYHWLILEPQDTILKYHVIMFCIKQDVWSFTVFTVHFRLLHKLFNRAYTSDSPTWAILKKRVRSDIKITCVSTT